MTWQWSISPWSLTTIQERIPGPNSSVFSMGFSPLNIQFCSLMSQNWVRKLTAEEGLEGRGWERVGIGKKRNYCCSQTVCVCWGCVCHNMCKLSKKADECSQEGATCLGGSGS